MTTAEIARKIDALPPALRQEVADFVDFIEHRHQRHASGEINLAWAGALRDMRDQYSSVELQHVIADIRAADKGS